MNLPENAEILIGTKAMKTADVLVWKYQKKGEGEGTGAGIGESPNSDE